MKLKSFYKIRSAADLVRRSQPGARGIKQLMKKQPFQRQAAQICHGRGVILA